MGTLKLLVKSLAGRLVSEYRINWIYASPTFRVADPPLVHLHPSGDWLAALDHSPTPKMRNAAKFARVGLAGLVVVERDRPVSAAHFATAAQYDRGSTWRLGRAEIALMDIATEESERGKGHAVRLVRAATHSYQNLGCPRLIAFIWWTNRPSVAAFAKAGWRRIGLSVEFCRNGRWMGFRLPLRSH